MSRRSSPASANAWGWRRWIDPLREEEWLERLRQRGVSTWVLTEKPGRLRRLLEVYSPVRKEAQTLARELGGEVRHVTAKEWLAPQKSAPLRVGSKLLIVREKTRPGKIPRLYLPHGLAFGSGEHATTFMLLRALLNHPDVAGKTVLDLGTGSGVLALAARLLGARRIVATDWDAEAVRTARQNEALNFRESTICWQRADVKRLGSRTRYALVLANLFSGILCEAASRIADALAPGGELWLSGVLLAQEKEVARAYRKAGLRLVHAVHRGKWVMLQWRKPAAFRPSSRAEASR